MTDVLPLRYLDALPLSVIFLGTTLLLLAFSELGFRIGRRWHTKGLAELSQTGAITGASLGLLAFMLAFSFGMAGSRFDVRKQAVLDEANAIGTTWLRSQMLPAPHPTEIAPLLRRYVEVRLEGSKAESIEELRIALAESEQLHKALWAHAVTLGKEAPRSVIVGLFTDALNEVIDLHGVRVNVARHRIPRSVWGTLYFIAFAATMLVGVHAGLSGGRSLLITALLALTLSVVMVLIIDLDRPGQTLFSVSQQSLADLRESMASP